VASGAARAAGVEERCLGEDLGLLELRPEHFAACHLAAVAVGKGQAVTMAKPQG
jgi:hypothetical protein